MTEKNKNTQNTAKQFALSFVMGFNIIKAGIL
jgi:hypothetical protein